jgi:pimeloyl-ACP methyl ester carboxylesterase
MPTVKVNDIGVYYELRGEGNPVVLIAGLGTSISPYMRIVVRLAQRRRVLAFDNRGVGRTDKPDVPYTIEMMADDTAGLLEALGIARADVIGVSMGGRIAMALALQHPERVRSLVLASTSARVLGGTRSGPRFRFFKFVKWLRTGGRFLGRNPQPYYAFIRQFRASGGYDCSGRLGEIRVPTLILHGRRDRLAPYELAEEMHAGIKGSKLVAFEGGHLFLIWESDRFTDTVNEFLGGLGPAAHP